jgi:hypothetical protein
VHEVYLSQGTVSTVMMEQRNKHQHLGSHERHFVAEITIAVCCGTVIESKKKFERKFTTR